MYLESVLENHNKLLAEINQDIERYKTLKSEVETLQN